MMSPLIQVELRTGGTREFDSDSKQKVTIKISDSVSVRDSVMRVIL